MGACEEECTFMRPDESGLGFSSPCPSSPSSDTVQALEGELNALGLGDVDSHETSPSVKEADLRSSGKSRHYPLRAGELDCVFYLRTGTCRFGSNCKFNHPPRRKNRAVKDKAKDKENETENENEKENEKEKEALGQQETKVVKDKEMEKETENDKEKEKDRSGQLACKYYLKSGGCKFGKACRYSHPQERAGEEERLELNYLGLPIRLGERECPFYMRTGSCKFSTNCRFHHPDPTAIGGSDSHSGYQNDQNIQLHTSAISQRSLPSWTSPRVSNEPISYMNASPLHATMMPLPQGVHSNLEWDGYHAPVASPLFPPERNRKPPSAMAVNNLTKDVDNPTHKTAMNEYPERPGQPECQYFMRNGDCKFRSACRYHHPKDRASKSSACMLSPMGLPLRPDQIICTHYRRYGICKFGPACKFNHPLDVASSDRPASPAAPSPAAPPSEICSSCSWE